MAKEWLRSSMLTLRSPEPEDLELMYRMENDTALWSVGSATLPYSRHTLRNYLEQSVQDIYHEHQARFVIELSDGSAVGMIDLADFDLHNSRAEVCIGLLSEYRMRGLGREALLLLCDYAMNFLHIHQLYAYIPVSNVESETLFSSVGFVRSALLKEWKRMPEGYCDVLLFQLIA